MFFYVDQRRLEIIFYSGDGGTSMIRVWFIKLEDIYEILHRAIILYSEQLCPIIFFANMNILGTKLDKKIFIVSN